MRFFRGAAIQRKLMLVTVCTSLAGLSLAFFGFELYGRAYVERRLAQGTAPAHR